jgi:AraC family transcriptional regulator
MASLGQLNFERRIKMQPDKIETKRLRLVGLEMYVSLQENFVYKLYAMRAQIKARLGEIQNRKNNQHVGFWQWQFMSGEGYNTHRNYFCAVEVTEFKDIPYGMICKNLPESKYAVFTEKNGEEGTITEKQGVYQNWLPKSGYTFNSKISGDFEVYDFDEQIENHEVWIPVEEK